MIPRTDFHCITTWLHILLGEIWQCICLFCGFLFSSQMFSNRVHIDCKTKLCFIIPGRYEEYIFTHESFNQQGILNDINEQDIFS